MRSLPFSLKLKPLLFKTFESYAAGSFRQLEQALQQPLQAQMQALSQILAGINPQAHGLNQPIHSYAELKKLPLQRYEDLHSRIAAARLSGKDYLTCQKPFTHEPTSGSSGAQKWIPYTPALRQAFSQLFLCWAHDFLRYGPPLQGGRIYFSVSPQFRPEGAQAADEGLADDSEYLSGFSRWAFQQFAVAPPGLKALQQPEHFWLALACHLLACPDLEIISVWSPSFLLRLLAFISENRLQILRLLQQAEFSLEGQTFQPQRLGGALPAVRQSLLMPEPQAVQLFPKLRLISCWGAQNARAGFLQLQQLFPGVHLQEKGLLATEAPISFFSEKYQQFLPLLQTVFFEFLATDGQVLLLHQLQPGQVYELVISQTGGLLRYRLGDSVKVVGQVHQTPCFQFVGRQEAISDLVGEKLNEVFVAEALAPLFTRHPALEACLLPDLELSGYLLLSNQPLLEAEISALEAALCQSLHYYHARQLGQLCPLQVQVQPQLNQRLRNFFSQVRQLKLGDQKDRLLYAQENNGQLRKWLNR